MIETLVDCFDIWGKAQTQKSKGKKAGIENISLHGINRLRELILELAIRGRLVPQIATDEPASKFLKKCLIEKNRLFELGNLKRYNKENVGQVDNEKPFKIPENWEWSWFSDVYYFQEGPGIRNWQFRTEGVKLLNVQNIVDGQLILDNTDKYISKQEYIEKYQHFTIQENDLLFASSGGSWGKTAFFNDPGYKVIVNTSTIRIFPFYKECSHSFMRNIVDSSFFKKQMIEQLVGMQPNFGSTHLLKIFMPLPPLKEQYRITEKVDELMALCDKLEQEQMNHIETHLKLVEALLQTLTDAKDAEELKVAWQHLEPNFDILFTTEESVELLKQTILQLAVMGKLVPQDPNDEPASVLLEKITAEKQRLIKEGKIKKQKPLPEITEEEKPFELPEGWSFERMGNVTVRIGSGSTPRGGKSAYVNSGVIFLRSQNVWNEGIELSDVAYIPHEIHEKMSNTKVYPDDILLNITGGSLGRCTIFPKEYAEANVSQHVSILRLVEGSMKNYIHNCILSPYIQSLIWGRQVGMAREGLSKKVLELFEIPVPPLQEQIRIVNKIDELMSLCDQLKERIIATQELKVKLADAVVEQAVKAKPEKVYEVSNNLDMAAEPGPKK